MDNCGAKAQRSISGMSSPGRARNDEILASTDPFSFLNDPELLRSISETLSVSVDQPASQPPFLNGWSDSNPPENLGIPGFSSSHVDLCGVALNDADSSIGSMGALLRSYSQFMALPDSSPVNAETMASGSIVWNQPSSSSFPADGRTYSSWNPGPASSTSSLTFTPSPGSERPLSEFRAPKRPSTSPASSTSQGGVDPSAQARQIPGLKWATHTGTTINGTSQKVPIPRLHPPPFAVAPKSAASSSQVVASPSSTASTNSRTKLSHCAVERRYRTNMRQHLKNLRGIVPALRVLELKTGNRVSNLSLKPGTRRAGIDAGSNAEGADVIDERGFIDGVKVARNGSKTTAIMKTIEYVRVLKRREMRLKHEQEGLKNLVRSFPEGSMRLRQWETEWREKFGGPEKDEIEEITDLNEDGPDDADVDSMDDIEGYTSMSGQENAKRPKAGIASSSSDEGKKAVPTSSGQVRNGDVSAPKRYVAIRPAPSFDAAGLPLANAPSQTVKRKRGRPRKNPLPQAVTLPGGRSQGFPAARSEVQPVAVLAQEQRTSNVLVAMDACSNSAGLQTELDSGQYLFAIFTFVAFFTSPLSLSPTSYGTERAAVSRTHTTFGSVLTGSHVGTNIERRGIPAIPLNWRDIIHLVHLVFSVYFVFSIMRSRLFRLLRSPKLLFWRLPRLGSAITSFPISLPRSLLTIGVWRDPGERFRRGARKLKELSHGKLVMPAVETQIFCDGLGLQPGLLGLIRTLLRLLRSPVKHEHWRLERRVFMRVVELVALDANSPLCTRLQVFLGIFQYGHGCTMTATELSSLALAIYPIWRAKAAWLWDVALGRVHGRSASSPYIYKPYETFILETMSIDEAYQAVARLHSNAGARVMTIVPENGLCRGEYGAHRELASPFAALTRQLVHEYIRAQAENTFIRITCGEEEASDTSSSEGGTIDYERLLVSGRALDPPTVALLNYFDQVVYSKPTDRAIYPDSDIVEGNVKEWGDFSRTHAELKALLDGIVLCRSSKVCTDGKGPSLGKEFSASHRNPALSHELNQVLNSTAFDRTDALRSARNHALEILVTR